MYICVLISRLGGFGGTDAVSEDNDSFAKERREQGYGGGKDMDRSIGA